MKIVICGSMSFSKEMLKTEEALKKLGHEVVLPEFVNDHANFSGEGEMPENEEKGDLIKKHFEEIRKSDAILVLNIERKKIKGYVGGNSFLEMGFAFVLNKSIYLFEQIPDIGYKDEIEAMSPIILGGNFLKIKEDLISNDSHEDYYNSLPKKRMCSGVLIFNQNDELLIVKPSYKDHWSIPGGVIEENESPRLACIRETEEETGLYIENLEFLSVDFVPPKTKVSENLHFIFFGGILKEEEIKKIKILNEEIEDYKFLTVEKALLLLGKNLGKRIEKSIEALKNRKVIYMENGK
ncbi:MAG: NUDIX hydrolase [Candidatus Paceibacterota bacterium]|jgi:ADP-ribose pyrophosphatase YjhB (NUDIX family)/nucleoside 2-deoxyribosyltransferase